MISNYLNRDKSKRNRAEGEYWPSQVFGCVRRQFYSQFIPEEYTEETLALFTAGDVFHDFFGRLLEQWGSARGYRVLREVSLRIPHTTNPSVVLSGRADDIIILYEEKERYVVEVKTTQKLSEQMKHNQLPRKEHLGQLNIYLRAYPGSKGIILYLDRSTLKTKQFVVSYNDDLYDEAMNRIEILHRHILSRTLPEPEAKRIGEAWRCKMCTYKAVCDKNENPALTYSPR